MYETTVHALENKNLWVCNFCPADVVHDGVVRLDVSVAVVNFRTQQRRRIDDGQGSGGGQNDVDADVNVDVEVDVDVDANVDADLDFDVDVDLDFAVDAQKCLCT